MNTRSVLKGVVAVGLLGMASMSLAAEETWTKKTDMPTARFGLSTSVVHGRIYAIGGGQTPYGAYLSTVEVYDPVTNTWTRKADMPTARSGHAAAAVNGKIYVIGGEPREQSSLATVEAYDPATDSWTQKTGMPTRRTFLCTCVVNGKIYAFGGVTAGGPGGNSVPTALEVYDPATDAWSRKADMPMSRNAATAGVVDGRIYVIGGVVGDLEGAALSTVHEYDPETDTWMRKANMPTARMWPSSSVLNGKIYVVGGANFGGPVFSTVEEYDPTTDIWITKLDMPTRRGMLSTSVVNGNIYAIGGTRIWWPWTGASTVEEYDCGLSVAQPDFNGDGNVDGKDILILAEYWGQANPICDLAPSPFGDGLIDLQDLIALAEHIGKEVDDPTLVAHWALDEAEGTVARDSAGDNDGTVVGIPVWHPEGGMVNGALELDGTYCVVTESVLNPAGGPFSVLAWVKGGAENQAIISQTDGANWLMVDASGVLMTELKSAGRSSMPLCSDTAVTDGAWYRIGFTWDGFERYLYVDSTLVAQEADVGLADCPGGLNIGCGKNMALATFFTGLIDDVRIYRRAVRP